MDGHLEIRHEHHGGTPRFGELLNDMVSPLAPFSGLILTVTAVVLAVIRIFFVDKFLLQRIYPRRISKSLTDIQRRSFLNHHVAATTKIILIIVTAYPLLSILIGTGTPKTRFAPGSIVTLGDVLIVSSQLFTVMYIFELFYREKVSPISCAHHVGAIVIAQSAIAMSINFDHEKDALPEFVLCFVWGAFDVVAELWPHVAMIMYRTHADDHHLLYRIFQVCMWLELVGTISETAVVMWLFGSLWDRWTLSLKVVTPFLHVLFSAAQLWGAYVMRLLAQEQRKKMEQCEEDSIKQEA